MRDRFLGKLLKDFPFPVLSNPMHFIDILMGEYLVLVFSVSIYAVTVKKPGLSAQKIINIYLTIVSQNLLSHKYT